MDDNGYFVKKLFLKHARLNTAAQTISVIGPIISGMLAGTLFGNMGLAVTGLFSPLFFLAGFLGTVVASGSATLASRLLAQDDIESVNGLYTLALLMTAALGAVLCIGMVWGRETIIGFVVKDQALIPYVRAYYSYCVPYVFFTALVYMPLTWSRLAGKPGIGMLLTVVLSGATVSGTIVTAYGFHMGVEGIALSQAAATALAFFCAALPLRLSKGGLSFARPSRVWSNCAQIMLIGSPIGLSRLYRFVCILLINIILLESYGSGAVAIYSVLNMLLRFVTAFATGVSGAVMPIAGVFHEERDAVSIKQLMRAAFYSGNAAMLTVALALLAFRGQMAVLFGIASADIRTTFFYALAAFCVYILFFFNGSVFIAYYTATAKVWIANILAFSLDMLFLPLLVFLLIDVWDINMIWLHFPLSGAATALVLFGLWGAAKKRDKNLVPPLLLDRNLEENGKYISFSVDNDVGKASEASARIGNFCEENALSPKQTMLISMSIEEIITLIVNNAALRGHDDSISVRLFLLDGSIVLRIRNNGRKFNPIAYYKENISGDIEKNLDLLGLKYIVETAEVVYYRETFGVNNLVVII